MTSADAHGNEPDTITDMAPETTRPHSTALEANIDALQDTGHNVYIAGYTPDRSHALIVNVDTDTVTVASQHTVNGTGRWECSRAHYQDCIDTYITRFPNQP